MGEMGQFRMAPLSEPGTPSGKQESPSHEVRALLRLRDLGIQEVYGEAIARLLSLAQERAQAQERLSRAEQKFQQILSGESQREPAGRHALSDENEIKSAFREVEGACEILQGIEYPDKPDFDFRRLALQADKARAQALKKAIDLWWQRRFLETANEFNQRLSLPPSEKSLDDAQWLWNEAKRRYDDWPESESQRRQQASQTLSEMNNRLEETRQKHPNVRLQEAGYWLDRAEEHLPTEPFVALSSLNHARMILDSLKTGGQVEFISPDVQETQQQLDSLGHRANQALRRHLADQRQKDFSSTAVELERQWQAWLSRPESQHSLAHAQEADRRFISGQDSEAQARRALLDKIRLCIYLDPAAAQDDWLEKLVLMRHDDLLRAQQLRQDVESRWNLGGMERGRCLYWAWQRISRAFEYDPDSTEIARLRDQVQEHWMDAIAQEWNNSTADILQLIPPAKSFLNQPEISDDIKACLRESIKKQWAKWSAAPPSHVLSAYQQLGLGEVRSQPAVSPGV